MDRENNATFKTALYMRLSKDDDSGMESASIASQRNILHEYARTMGFEIRCEFVDDGYSGTTYDRPAFGKMLREIEVGRIDCILIKDLSRLGRNSARTTDLLDEYFPMHGVRLISVTDGYDSLHLTSGIAMSTSFLVALHEMYARDISTKIRTSLQAKMRSGEYIASFAPYGYRKDPQNKNRLIANEETAPIVRRIFKMAISGDAPHVIAEKLRCDGITTPEQYRLSGLVYEASGEHCRWSSSMICKLLANIVYLGHTAQGKTHKLSFKSKKTRANRREDWIVVEHTHEPLISEEEFQLARSRSVARRCMPSRDFQNIFSGIAVCADCRHAMTTAPSRKRGAVCNLCCGAYKAHGTMGCSNHFIDYELLYDTVLSELKRHLGLNTKERQALLEKLSKASERAGENYIANRGKVSDRIENLRRLIARLYEDYAQGRVGEAVFRAAQNDYEAELCGLEGRLDAMDVSRDGRSERQTNDALITELCGCRALTKELVQAFIERIEIGQGSYVRDKKGERHKEQSIRIVYRFFR